MIHYPCRVDGVVYENTREAYKALFLRDGIISYDKLQRALKKGRRDFFGHTIERVIYQYEVTEGKKDYGTLKAVSPYKRTASHERKPGDPLLRYPKGESPLERGLLVFH